MEPYIAMIFKSILGVAVGLGMFILRMYGNRLSEIESQLTKMVSEPQVRIILNDKIEPMRERIYSIETKIDKILDIMIEQNKGK